MFIASDGLSVDTDTVFEVPVESTHQAAVDDDFRIIAVAQVNPSPVPAHAVFVQDAPSPDPETTPPEKTPACWLIVFIVKS